MLEKPTLTDAGSPPPAPGLRPPWPGWTSCRGQRSSRLGLRVTARWRAHLPQGAAARADEPGLLIHASCATRDRILVAPLRANDALPSASLDGFSSSCILPGGGDRLRRGPLDAQWMAFGAILRQGCLPTARRFAARVRVEGFVSRHVLSARPQRPDRGARFAGTDPSQRELGGSGRRSARDRLAASADGRNERGVRARPTTPVVCHADIHTHNVLLDGDGRLWIVD